MRKNIIMPADHWEAIAAAAAASGQNVSEWLREAAKDKLPKRVAAGLSEARGPGAPCKQND